MSSEAVDGICFSVVSFAKIVEASAAPPGVHQSTRAQLRGLGVDPPPTGAPTHRPPCSVRIGTLSSFLLGSFPVVLESPELFFVGSLPCSVVFLDFLLSLLSLLSIFSTFSTFYCLYFLYFLRSTFHYFLYFLLSLALLSLASTVSSSTLSIQFFHNFLTVSRLLVNY